MMKRLMYAYFMLFVSTVGYTQVKSSSPSNVIEDMTSLDMGLDKGKLYIYWGWNRGWYTDSDIRFEGVGYDFELSDVVAKDRQTPFSLKKYFGITNLTIPQYNFRMGYYLSDHWDLSLGFDHMKYVVRNGQSVIINGSIGGDNPYNGKYKESEILLKRDFLTFEHTDGLNYINFEFRRSDNVIKYKKMTINLNEGVGIGIMLPRTNTKLLSKDRYDEVHLAGYGLSAVVGARIIFYDHYFIQSEAKVGYINMPDIRTTNNELDKASQYFYFSQVNIVFGGIMNIGNRL